MSEIIIRKIDKFHASDVRIPNQPFKKWGRMILGLSHGKWSYTTEKLDQITEDCFPDEPYDFAKDDAIFIGAYDGDKCIGLAMLRRDMFSIYI